MNVEFEDSYPAVFYLTNGSKIYADEFEGDIYWEESRALCIRQKTSDGDDLELWILQNQITAIYPWPRETTPLWHKVPMNSNSEPSFG